MILFNHNRKPVSGDGLQDLDLSVSPASDLAWEVLETHDLDEKQASTSSPPSTIQRKTQRNAKPTHVWWRPWQSTTKKRNTTWLKRWKKLHPRLTKLSAFLGLAIVWTVLIVTGISVTMMEVLFYNDILQIPAYPALAPTLISCIEVSKILMILLFHGKPVSTLRKTLIAGLFLMSFFASFGFVCQFLAGDDPQTLKEERRNRIENVYQEAMKEVEVWDGRISNLEAEEKRERASGTGIRHKDVKAQLATAQTKREALAKEAKQAREDALLTLEKENLYEEVGARNPAVDAIVQTLNRSLPFFLRFFSYEGMVIFIGCLLAFIAEGIIYTLTGWLSERHALRKTTLATS